MNGAIMHSLLLTRQLAKDGHFVMLICREGSWISQQFSDCENVEVVESSMNRWPFNEIKRVSNLLISRKMEVIQTHMSRAHNFGIALKYASGIPTVVTAHSHKVHPHFMLASHIIAVSKLTERYHRIHNLVSRNRITTVHGFVDLDRFSNMNADCRELIRESLGIAGDQLLVGVVGDFLPRKGQDILLKAIPEISREVPNVMFAFAGSVRKEDYFDSLKRDAKSLGIENSILWLGYRDDVPKLLQALDVYVLPSKDEMFPVALLEAMASYRACVASRAGGIPECDPEGTSLKLVEPSKPASLASAIVTLLRDSRARLKSGEAAHAAILKHFNVEHQAHKVQSVLSKVATMHNSPHTLREQVR